jgi:hypothetical protein
VLTTQPRAARRSRRGCLAGATALYFLRCAPSADKLWVQIDREDPDQSSAHAADSAHIAGKHLLAESHIVGDPACFAELLSGLSRLLRSAMTAVLEKPWLRENQQSHPAPLTKGGPGRWWSAASGP